jgi:hypothetical protein
MNFDMEYPCVTFQYFRVKDEPIVIDEERKAMAIKRTKKMVKFQMDSATSSKDATAKINAPFKRIDFDQFLESVKAKYENDIGTKVGTKF